MSDMAMALQEAEEDRQVARRTVRGIIAAATKRQAAASESLANRAEKIAAVAAAHAAAVDSNSCFPSEAIDAARAARLLSAAVPVEFGGEGAKLSEIVDVCYRLGRSCAATAMIYAMHQTKVACVVRHGVASAWH